MRLTLQQRAYLGVLCVAGVALAVDRLLLGGGSLGPDSAQAAAGGQVSPGHLAVSSTSAPGGSPLAATRGQPSSTPQVGPTQNVVHSRLESIRAKLGATIEASPDAFATPKALAPAAVETRANSALEPRESSLPGPSPVEGIRVSSVIPGASALVSRADTPEPALLRLGATMGELRLGEIGDRYVVFTHVPSGMSHRVNLSETQVPGVVVQTTPRKP
ncbi:MAG: hypothetical protein SFZ23_03020 [Planctomycetota bacterium]|nr:hypothetical protein [Planctomycetota bacterium]